MPSRRAGSPLPRTVLGHVHRKLNVLLREGQSLAGNGLRSPSDENSDTVSARPDTGMTCASRTESAKVAGPICVGGAPGESRRIVGIPDPTSGLMARWSP